MRKNPSKLRLSKETLLGLDTLTKVRGAADSDACRTGYCPSADRYCQTATIWTQGCPYKI